MVILGLALVCFGMAWTGYVYVGYPTLIALLAFCRTEPGQSDWSPRVDLVISAFNEEAVIGEKLANALALDYPNPLLRVWVSSDGSTDRTVALAQAIADCCARVHVVAHEVNRGKTSALMATFERLPPDAEIVVLSDANSLYRPDAIRRLVSGFADDSVGAVAGELRYLGVSAEGAYRRYENWIKRNESRFLTGLTVEGSIFAVRRVLLPRLHHDEIEDVAIPLTVAISGKRVQYAADAISEERFSLSPGGQYARRRRIVNRALRTTWRHNEILRPWKTGVLSLMFVSHRVMRWFSPLAIIAAGVGGATIVVCASRSLAFCTAALMTIIAGVFAGYLVRGRRRLGVAWAFLVAVAAMAAGVASACRGVAVVAWEPQRSETPEL